MYLYEFLVEDVNDDVEGSVYAEVTRRAIINQLHTKGFIGIGYVTPHTNDDKVNQVNNASGAPLVIKFCDVPSPMFSSNYGSPTIAIPIEHGTTPEAINFLSSSAGASSFRHEYQHYIDFVLDGRSVTSYNGMDKNHPNFSKIYYNDDGELNAYFHELAEPALVILRAAYLGQTSTETIDPDFMTFVRYQLRSHIKDKKALSAALAYHTDESRKLFYSRLMAIHKAACMVQSEKYQPSLREKVFSWLGRTLNVGNDANLKKLIDVGA